MPYENCDNHCCDWSLRYDLKNGTEKDLEQIPGSPNLAKMQKRVLTITAHILRKTLSFVEPFFLPKILVYFFIT